MKAGEYGSITAADVRREALRLINNVVTNSLKDQALEAFGYISGVTDLAATLIGEEEDGE
jgi:hypothetical protein